MGTTVFATTTAPGPQGPPGPPGYSPVYIVAPGPPSNAIGNNGDMYIDSTNGNVYGPKVSGAWGAIVCNIKGSTGATGAQGPPGYSPVYIVAAGPPGAGVGNDHDMYINSTTSDVYGPKTSGAWGGIQCNIKGATGSQGPPGVAYTPKGAWVSTTTYAQGDEVTSGNQLYISLQANNIGHDPATSPTWWQQVGSGASQTPWLSDIDGAGFRLKNAGAIQSTGGSNPTSGAGLELNYAAPTSYITSYDRTAGAFKDLNIGAGLVSIQSNGAPLQLNPAGGNVGIGTTSPTVLLSLGAVNVPKKFAIYDDGLAANFFGLGLAPGMLRHQAGANGGHVFYVNDTVEAMRIAVSGNVGIGNDGTGLAFSGYPQLIVGPSTASSACGLIMGCGNVSGSGGSVASFSGVNWAIPGTDKRIAEMRIDTDGGIDSGALDFGTYLAGTRSTRIRVTSAGNVGIGTTTPASRQHIFADGSNPSVTYRAGGAILEMEASFGVELVAGAMPSPPYPFWIQAVSNANLGALLLINPNGGNVGIGTTNPTARLHSKSSGSWYPGAAGINNIAFLTEGAFGGGIGLIDGSSTLAIWSQGGIFYFGTGNTSSGTTSRMVITPTGRVGIGLESPSYALDASGDVNCSGVFRVNGVPIATGGGVNIQINSGGASGPFTYLNFYALSGIQISNGGIGGPGNNTMTIQIGQASDARLKRDVQPLNGGLAQIMQLRPITGEWNGLAYTREGQRLISVLAQDLQAVIPNAVEPYKTRLQPEDAEDIELLAVDHMALTCHLILAVQELERRLKELEARVN